MKPDEIDFVAEIARAGAGLQVDRERVYLLESRLAPVARREGFGSIREMLLAGRQRREEKLLWSVVEALAAGETCFFRDSKVFDRLREEILPSLAVRRDSGPIRIWSAGCSGGQEAYSLAFAAEDAGGGVLARGVDILGTDLSDRALEKAQSGLYTQFEVQRGLPIRLLVRHFEKRDELWALSPRVRSMVRWKRVNLNSDFRSLGSFDVILCRNVTWAMEPRSRTALLEQLAGSLAPGGFLVLGAEEAPAGLDDAFLSQDGGMYRLNPAFRAAA